MMSTKKESNMMIAPKKDTMYWDILHCIIIHPQKDYTSREIHQYITTDIFGNYNENNILAGTMAGRISEMKQMGYLSVTFPRKCEVSKRRVKAFDIANDRIVEVVEEHYERIREKEAEEAERKKELKRWFS